MAAFTKIYLDQNLKGKEIKLAIIMSTIRDGLNDIIQKSYDEHKIAEKEISKMPFIRNRSRADVFTYEPRIIGQSTFETFRIKFNIFVSPEVVGGFPQDEFGMIKPNTKVHHQARFLTINTEMNCDAAGLIPNLSLFNKKITLFLWILEMISLVKK